MEYEARISRTFRDVDHAEAPEANLRYLAAVSGTEQARELKARTIDLLALSPGQAALDVGCGTGDEVRAMASRVGPAGRAVEVDGSAVMIEEARERSREGHPAVEFRQADAHAFPLADATFDACRVERTLQHVADPRRVVAEMVRVAKPGARIVAMEPDWGTIFVEGGGREATSALIRARADLITRHGWIGRALPGLLREAGLERVTPFAEVFQLTDLALARYLIGFDESAEAAQAAGWLRPADYAAWLGALEAASARGTFFAGLVAFIVAGTKRSPTIG